MRWLSINRSDWSDAQLLNRYREHSDTDSLGVLYDRYLHLVYGLCLKYLKNRDDSQDAVMDIYQVLVAKLTTQEVNHFKSWLYIVTKNHCLMKLRKINREVHLDETFMEIPVSPHLNDEPHIEADLKALEQCIEQLKEEQKRCVSEFYLKEKSYQEISGLTQLELKKVKSHIQNGKRNLKICLESKDVKR